MQLAYAIEMICICISLQKKTRIWQVYDNSFCFDPECSLVQPSVCYSFLEQADHLRQQTLKRMSHLLTTRQAAQGLLALGEYFHRLRVLSSLWATRPREPA